MGSMAARTRALVWDHLYRPTAASVSANVARNVARDRRSRDAGSVRKQQHTPTSELSGAARAFRAFHAAIAVEQLLSIGYVWWCALSGRRGLLLRLAAATLIGEGVLVTANGGDCPLGGLQDRLGDPVPLFELVLSPPAAKRAVPTLGVITAAGLVLLVAPGRRDGRQAA